MLMQAICPESAYLDNLMKYLIMYGSHYRAKSVIRQ
jgi:hypothetical protein